MKGKDTIQALTVNLDMAKEPQMAKTFAEEKGLTIPILYVDPQSEEHPLSQLDPLQIRAVPTNYFLDAEGVILSVRMGAVGEEELKKFEESYGK